jgi:hypothetical protein
MLDNRIVYTDWEGHPALVWLELDRALAFINGTWREIDRVDASQHARVIGRDTFMRRMRELQP